MITKLLPVKDTETQQIVGYREIITAIPASNMALMVVYAYDLTSPLLFSFEDYNTLPDLSLLENGRFVQDPIRDIWWPIEL